MVARPLPTDLETAQIESKQWLRRMIFLSVGKHCLKNGYICSIK